MNSQGNSSDSNVMGIVGLVVSILGILTCGILSPIGLVLSLIGLMKPPKGMAIAGTVLGLLGSILLATVGYGFLQAYFLFGEGMNAVMGILEVESGKHALVEYVEENDALPATEEGQLILDNNGLNLQYVLEADGTATITTAGADEEFGTEDDYIEEMISKETVLNSIIDDTNMDTDPQLDINFNPDGNNFGDPVPAPTGVEPIGEPLEEAPPAENTEVGEEAAPAPAE